MTRMERWGQEVELSNQNFFGNQHCVKLLNHKNGSRRPALYYPAIGYVQYIRTS
jgi:hypothetical protein